MKYRLKKILLPAVFLAASASFTLTGQSCSMPKGNTQPDTIVRAEFVDSSDEWKKTEYYVTTKKDTSALSCIISTRDGKVKNVEFYNLVGPKICFTGKNISKNDTAAVGYASPISYDFYSPTYKETIHEIELCLDAASKVYDLTTMDAMSGFLSTFGDIAVMTTNLLNANCKLNEHGLMCRLICNLPE